MVTLPLDIFSINCSMFVLYSVSLRERERGTVGRREDWRECSVWKGSNSKCLVKLNASNCSTSYSIVSYTHTFMSYVTLNLTNNDNEQQCSPPTLRTKMRSREVNSRHASNSRHKCVHRELQQQQQQSTTAENTHQKNAIEF